MTVTLTELHGDIFTAIAEASGAEVAALQAGDNTANIRSTTDNLTVWVNEAGEALARRCVALRGRHLGLLLPGSQTIPWVAYDGSIPELVESPIGTPCSSSALGAPWGVFGCYRTEGRYSNAAESRLIHLFPSRFDVLQRWRGVAPPDPVAIDPVMPSPLYWCNVSEMGVFVAPAVGRSIDIVADTLNSPVALVNAADKWAWLPIGGRRLLVAYAAARVCEIRREDETLHARAPEFWAEFYSGVVRLYNDLPLDVRGLFPVPEPGKMAKG